MTKTTEPEFLPEPTPEGLVQKLNTDLNRAFDKHYGFDADDYRHMTDLCKAGALENALVHGGFDPTEANFINLYVGAYIDFRPKH